jgi:hypothetical protein
MLHLEPRVHLEEPEAAVSVVEELGGRHVLQPGRDSRANGHRVQSAPLGFRQARRGRLLDELLVASLRRAIPLAQRDHLPGRVTEELDLDVARGHDLALQVDGAVAEGSSSAATTRRIPRPPPPATALMRGKPTASTAASTAASCSGRSTGAGSSVPGTCGTSAARAVRRAASLPPSVAIVAADEPTNTSPASSTARANAARSDREPYPGWTASAPDSRAAETAASIRR